MFWLRIEMRLHVVCFNTCRIKMRHIRKVKKKENNQQQYDYLFMYLHLSVVVVAPSFCCKLEQTVFLFSFGFLFFCLHSLNFFLLFLSLSFAFSPVLCLLYSTDFFVSFFFFLQILHLQHENAIPE